MPTYTTAGLLPDCVYNSRQLRHKNHVIPQSVPSHQEIKADKLAEEAANIPFICPNSCCDLQKSHIKQAINKWKDDRKASHCQNALGQEQVKALLSRSSKLAKMLLSSAKEISDYWQDS